MAGTHSYGTSMSFGGAISYIQSVSPVSDAKITQADATHLLSANARKEFVNGLVDEGNITLKLLFDRTQFNVFRGLVRTNAVAFTITYPELSTDTGTANIESMGKEVPEDGMIMANVTFKITGTVNFTPGP